jgi:curli production assembly/transport component CsgG
MRDNFCIAKWLSGPVIAAFLASCGTAPKVESKMAEPVVNPRTQTEYALLWLPKPDEQIPVAVYGVNDETGAFKPSESVQTLSRAVTQGATPILIKALQDAGDRSWFKVIEREKLDNLLKERQIILEMRQRYLGESAKESVALPALLFAGILIEGAITGYDTNTQTGGAGARYLGIGATTQYREDAVSVYLRAVSVKTGEVLISVSTEQRVASVAWQANAFKYVAYRELLEAEAGITLNQPRHVAVRQALEKAVYGLIIEGVKTGLWTFDDPDLGRTAIEFYDQKYRTEFSKDALKSVPKELLGDAANWEGADGS